ncbi:peptidoglycan DD-metalloendopeptidase family protein [Flavobacterium sp.]
MAPQISYQQYVPLNLSATNTDLENYTLVTAQDYEVYIQNILDKSNSKIAFGGYNEVRNLYKRSTVFKNQATDERNIHIGVDLWINEQATIHAALDGTIHSFQNNTALGDYGPTIILQHQIDGFTFHTLYGHLSLETLHNLTVGAAVTAGQMIGTLGLPPINGDYAPHLHFQIIIDMQNKTGDYPGVASKESINYYLENCPDPNYLLNIQS